MYTNTKFPKIYIILDIFLLKLPENKLNGMIKKKTHHQETREIVLRLRTFAALVEDWNSIPNIHRTTPIIWNSFPGLLSLCIGFQGHCMHMMHTFACKQNTHD